MDKPTVALGPWPEGMDNRTPAHSTADTLLRDALNVDLDTTGRARRREGLTRLFRGIDCRDLYVCPNGIYGIVDGVLGRFLGMPPTLTFTPILAGIQGPWTAYYLDGWVYWSDGVVSGKLDSQDQNWVWGVPAPAAPIVTSFSGALPPGRYLVWLVARLANGEESAVSEPIALDLATTAGLIVQTPAMDGVAWIVVYLTATNGVIGYQVGKTRPGDPLYVVAQDTSGKPLVPEVFDPAPAGNLIRDHGGRLYVVSGNTVWYSEPYSYGRFRLQSNYLSFSQPVSIFEPVTDGIWCVADKTYWAGGGNPKAFQWATQLDYGAIAGTGCQVPNSNDVMWMSQRGAILGMEGGQLQNLQEGHVAVNPGTEGAAFIREQEGLRQFIAAYQPSGGSPLIARDWIEARIIPR